MLGIRTELGSKIQDIMREHFGPGGDRILNNQLSDLEFTLDSLSPKELPIISEGLFNVTMPIIGKKRAENLQKEIKKLA